LDTYGVVVENSKELTVLGNSIAVMYRGLVLQTPSTPPWGAMLFSSRNVLYIVTVIIFGVLEEMAGAEEKTYITT
jgi:hypothetical protein